MNENNPNPIRIELEFAEQVQQHLDAGGSWHDVVIQHVNLIPLDELLGMAKIGGCHFLGCEIGPKLAAAIAQAEVAASRATTPQERKDFPYCMVLPPMPWVPLSLIERLCISRKNCWALLPPKTRK